MQIAGDLPDIIMINEVIPKVQRTPIKQARLSRSIANFTLFFNFDPTLHNVSASGYHGIAI